MTDDNRKPQGDTNVEAYDAPGEHIRTGPTSATPNPTITPEESHYDPDVERDPDSPPADDRITKRPTWLLMALAILVVFILYFLLR